MSSSWEMSGLAKPFCVFMLSSSVTDTYFAEEFFFYLRRTLNEKIRENIAYLRDVLGVRYLPIQKSDDVRKIVNSEIKPLVEKSELIFSRMAERVKVCQLCRLSRTRRFGVAGEGSLTASVIFMGESPGEKEDQEGLPFVGPGGSLLTKMIEAMGLKREEVFVSYLVKCRPPLNRSPEEDERETCKAYFDTELELVPATHIVVFGERAAQFLLKSEASLSDLRGRFFGLGDRKVSVTHHPNDILKNPSLKRSVWEDLQLVMRELAIKKSR